MVRRGQERGGGRQHLGHCSCPTFSGPHAERVSCARASGIRAGPPAARSGCSPARGARLRRLRPRRCLLPHFLTVKNGKRPLGPPEPRPASAALTLLLRLRFLSHKFGKKVTYFSYLSELREHLQCDQLPVPQEVLR